MAYKPFSSDRNIFPETIELMHPALLQIRLGGFHRTVNLKIYFTGKSRDVG